VAAQAFFVAHGGQGHNVGRLAAVEQVDDGFADGRLLVEVVHVLRERAQVLEGAPQPRGGADDAHVVPHGVADGGPVLRDEGRVLVVDVAGILPLRDGLAELLGEPPLAAQTLHYVLPGALPPEHALKQ